MGTAEHTKHTSPDIISQRQQNKSSGIHSPKHASEPHAPTGIATTHEYYSSELSMRQRRTTKGDTNNSSTMAQFSYPVGTVLEGRPGAQPPIFNDMGGIMANPSMQPAGSPDLLSQAYSQSHGGVVAASSSHHGRVPLATIVTAVPPVDLGSSSSEDIPNTNDPHFYSSPVAMEPPRGFMEQPKRSTPPAKARNKSSPRIHAAKIEKSTNIGHWTDGLVKPPPPLPPRNRTRSQDATTSSRASARSRGSQDSRTTMQSSDQRPSSSANHRITAQRMPELPHFGGIDTTIQMPGLEPLLEELNPNGLQPVTIPSHIHQFSSSNTMGTSPPSDPRAQSSGYIAGSLVSLPSSADSPPPITYASNQASWPGQCIPQRRRTDGPLHAGNLYVVSDTRSEKYLMTPGQFDTIDDASSIMTADTFADGVYKPRKWPLSFMNR